MQLKFIMIHFRRKLFFDIGTSLFIIAALVVGIIFFGRNITRHTLQISQHRETIVNRSASLDALASLIVQYNGKGKKYLDVLQGVIPVRDQLFSLKQEFQFIATQAGLDYSFEFLDEVPPEGETLGSLKFRVTIGGTLDKFLSFVRVIQHFRFLTTIDGITLARENLQKSRMVIRGQVFFR